MTRGRSMNAPTKFNKKVGHVINVFSFVMCPIFFWGRRKKDANVKMCNAHFGGVM